MFKFDEPTTKRRISELQRYFENNVLSENKFVCKHCSDCKKSVKKDLNFLGGQLSHVGKRYDLFKNGKELRIVISGIEYGHKPDKVYMANRYEMIVNKAGINSRYYSDGIHKGRDPHMRGTTLLLRRILLGEASLNNYDNWNTEFVGDIGQPEDHIFNMFALVNFLLCSVCGNGKKSKSTKPMKMTCSEHYMESLKILEPTLVIFQAKGLFEQVIDYMGISKCWKQDDEHFGHFEGHGLKFATCHFCHPATPLKDWAWGDNITRPYFQNTVLPTMKQALKEIGLE